jgi:hypothetical protein
MRKRTARHVGDHAPEQIDGLAAPGAGKAKTGPKEW